MNDIPTPRVRNRDHLYNMTWNEGRGYGNHLAHHLGVIVCLMKLASGFTVYVNGKPVGDRIPDLDAAKKRGLELALLVSGNSVPLQHLTGIAPPTAARIDEIARSA